VCYGYLTPQRKDKAVAYNKMHEVQFRDAVAASTDADVAEARDYWQRRADAHSAYDYDQRYADICRDELKARDEATTARVDHTYRLSAVEAFHLPHPDQFIRDNVVPGMKDDALEAGADPRSLTVEVLSGPEGTTIRVAGQVRPTTAAPTKGTHHGTP
jgi:hypothetical protein